MFNDIDHTTVVSKRNHASGNCKYGNNPVRNAKERGKTLAGHPPNIMVESDATSVTFSYNECPSVPKESVRRSLTALMSAGLLSDTTKMWLKNGRIYIVTERPTHIPTDRRTTAYKEWRKLLYAIVHTMNICIQSERAPRDVVRHIGRNVIKAA